LQCGEGVGFIHHTYIMLEPYWYCNSIFVPGSPRHLSHIEPSVKDHREPIQNVCACANADLCFPDIRLIQSVCSCMGELFFSTILNAAFATHKM
jgi:hypothetical protein